MALVPDSLDRIADHWAERLGCSPNTFRESGVPLVGSTGPKTVRLLHRDVSLVIGAPEIVRRSLSGSWDALGDDDSPAPAVKRVLREGGVSVESVHGPYFLGYVDESSFLPVGSGARLLVGADEPAFEGLRKRVPNEEWRRASPAFRPGRMAGLFRDDSLVALGTLTHLPFPDIGVVVDPEYRGRGFGRAVAASATATAFDANRGAVPRYRTPETSSASVALAESLGYERWAREWVFVLGD